MNAKPAFVAVDAEEARRLVAAGKYREHLPFWVRVGAAIWRLKALTQASGGTES